MQRLNVCNVTKASIISEVMKSSEAERAYGIADTLIG